MKTHTPFRTFSVKQNGRISESSATFQLLFVLFALLFASNLYAAPPKLTGLKLLARDAYLAIQEAPLIPGAAINEPYVSLRESLPPPDNQSPYNNCTAWAVAYGLKTYLEKKDQNWEIKTSGWFGSQKAVKAHVFSPFFVWNQLNGGENGGISIPDALNLIAKKGCATLACMDLTCTEKTAVPDSCVLEAKNTGGGTYKISNPTRINEKDIATIKSFLVAGRPVVIAAMVEVSDGGKWPQDAKGVTRGYSSPNAEVFAHAMLISGYDNNKSGTGQGAFEIFNSWGPDWNDKGFGWVGFDFFPSWAREAYVARDVTEHVSNPDEYPAAIPIGPHGLANGNWGYSKEIDVRSAKVTDDKKLPMDIKSSFKLRFKRAND